MKALPSAIPGRPEPPNMKAYPKAQNDSPAAAKSRMFFVR